MSERGRSIARLTPASVAGAAVLASIGAKTLAARLADPDLWWHLKTGAIVVGERTLPSGDLYSFTAAGRRWIVQEWGSEAILHAIRSAFGLRGIVVWRAVMLVVVYALVARLMVRDAGNRVATWVIVAAAAYAGALSWTERPNLFSFLLLVITLGLLRRRDRAIWWFVPIAALWANMHGMVLLGLGTVALVAASEGLKAWFRWEGSDPARARRLGLVALAGVLASFANPYGPGLHAHGFRLIGIVRDVVQEWAAPSFREAPELVFLGLALAVVAAMALTPLRPDPTDVALALASVALGLTAVRNLLPAGIVLGLVAARTIPVAIEDAFARRRGSRPRAEARSLPALNLAAALAVAGALVVLVAARFPASGTLDAVVDPGYPLDSIRAVPAGSRLFAKDDWGGLTAFVRWPQVRVAFDGRADMYGSALVDAYRRTSSGREGWEDRLRGWCVTHVLLASRDGLATPMAADRSWRLLRTEALGDPPGSRGEARLYEARAPGTGCG